MKIIEIIPQLSSGGAERFVVDLCNELVMQQHDVTLIVLHNLENAGFFKKDLLPEIQIISLNKKRGVDLLLLFRLYRQVKRLRPDIVHTHLRSIVYTLWGFIFPSGMKFVHTVHNDAGKEAGGRISTYIRKLAFSHKWTTPVTISPESRQSFIRFYGMDAPMILNGRNIPEHISISPEVENEFKSYRKSEQTKVLVNLARIDAVKRQTMLARIAARLAGCGYDFTLLFIGSTKYKDLVAEIESYDCDNIHILGERSNPLEYLKMADAYCLCSLYEGLPISLIEALGVGIVPVCTPVGGITDVIQNGINGLLSTDISEEAYYETLRHFLDQSSEDMLRLKHNARKSYAPYSMTECANQYVKLFRTLNK